MNSLEPKWDSHRIDDVVCIVDMGGAQTVAACIEHIVSDLRNGGELLGVRRCICCDGDGMWAEVLLSATQEFLGFAAVRTNSLCTALSLVGAYTRPPVEGSHVG
jgi:hypothetical protein